MFMKGANYRVPKPINWIKIRDDSFKALEDLITIIKKKFHKTDRELQNYRDRMASLINLHARICAEAGMCLCCAGSSRILSSHFFPVEQKA